MSVRKFLLSAWCITALLIPALALAQEGTCHEPCIMPGGTCNPGLTCMVNPFRDTVTCEFVNGDCGTRGNPGPDAGGGPGGNGGEDQGIVLLEPVGGVGNIPTVGNEGLGVFGFYFNLLYPWVVGMAAATAVLMAVVGGIQIIQAGGDQAAVGNGKNRLLISLGGLIIILASAIIMNALNPAFYQ